MLCLRYCGGKYLTTPGVITESRGRIKGEVKLYEHVVSNIRASDALIMKEREENFCFGDNLH
jgi:hypothetical protein